MTSRGVSVGIDGALWLVGRLHGRAHARAVWSKIQYDPLCLHTYAPSPGAEAL